MRSWIDVHTHLNMLETPAEQAVQQAVDQGVSRMISIGTHPNDLNLVLGFVDQFQPYVFGSLGIHPHEAEHYSDEIEAILVQGFQHPRIVAAGEMGLDFYYDNAPREAQAQVFRRQLTLAGAAGLPVEIHTRDAEVETIEILKEFQGRVQGLLHCFSGSQWLADQALALGFDISISGIVTFKNADSLRAVVRSVPMDRLHIETDSPFLAPVPYRGKKNVPAFVTATAQVVADLKGVTLDELSKATRNNAQRLFSKLTFD